MILLYVSKTGIQDFVGITTYTEVEFDLCNISHPIICSSYQTTNPGCKNPESTLSI